MNNDFCAHKFKKGKCNGVDHYNDISNHKVVDRHAYPRDTKDRR